MVFFYLYANVQRNVTWGIYYCLTIELDHAKRDSRLTAYGGVVLQRLDLYGKATALPVNSILLIFCK